MTRNELADLLEDEAWPSAADEIRNGKNPAQVLNGLRPFVSRYNDHISRARVVIFKAIIAGKTEVTP